MIDLRSDTVTHPSPAMLEAMAKAPLGDDVYGDDPTVNKLEALAAQMVGKEAAIFLPSGTMGNQLAIHCHTQPGEEIILGRHGHVYAHEAGAHARLSLVSVALIEDGPLGPTAAQVLSLLRDSGDLHQPRSSLLCLENATSLGAAVPLSLQESTIQAAKEQGLKVHLDGARLFNAALALGESPQRICRQVDTVMFCLSKGLSAPVGSMLCGSRQDMDKARRFRKVLGGAMRQAGVLAACGLVALESMVERLVDDHQHAALLAKGLAGIPGVSLHSPDVPINLVFASIQTPGFSDSAFVADLLGQGIKINPAPDGHYRFVTHRGISRKDVEQAVAAIGKHLILM